MPVDQKLTWSDVEATESLDMSFNPDMPLANYYNQAAYPHQSYGLYNPYYLRSGLLHNPATFYTNNYQAGFEYNYAYGMPGVQSLYAAAATTSNKPSSISTTQQQYRNNLTNGFNPIPCTSPSSSVLYSSGSTNSGQKTDKQRKSKRKKNAQPLENPEEYKRVFVWENEDLCDYPAAYQVEHNRLVEQVITGCFKLNGYELQEYDHINIDDTSVDDAEAGFSSTSFGSCEPDKPQVSADENHLVPGGSDVLTESQQVLNQTTADSLKKVAQKQRNMKKAYNAYRNDLESLLRDCRIGEEAKRILLWPEPFGQNLRQIYTHCLRIAAERTSFRPSNPLDNVVQQDVEQKTPLQRYCNVVLSKEHLPWALSRLLLIQHSGFVEPENVYSTCRNDRSAVIEKIGQRFKKEKLVIISGNPETIRIAKETNIPVWQVKCPNDVEKFQIAMNQVLCLDDYSKKTIPNTWS